MAQILGYCSSINRQASKFPLSVVKVGEIFHDGNGQAHKLVALNKDKSPLPSDGSPFAECWEMAGLNSHRWFAYDGETPMFYAPSLKAARKWDARLRNRRQKREFMLRVFFRVGNDSKSVCVKLFSPSFSGAKRQTENILKKQYPENLGWELETIK